ncbi:hypothetical protein ABD76_09720 [Paenibacillus dendritiformis]|nr:hypothetical protein [Paenibacillus dendritiformis]
MIPKNQSLLLLSKALVMYCMLKLLNDLYIGFEARLEMPKYVETRRISCTNFKIFDKKQIIYFELSSGRSKSK